MTARLVELRSDTFTRPTESMRRAMYGAEVGDDVWGEDPTVRLLEERASDLTGKEAAVFVTSGTQGNLVGLLSHTAPGDEVILGDKSHIFTYEVAGAAVVGGLQLRTLPNRNDGRLLPEEVRAAIRSIDIHFPHTGCVALENTHNRCGGAVLSVEEISKIAAVPHAVRVPVHLDGARIFNAATALGVAVSDLTAPVDSVTFCLSKALGAPVGSIVCGSVDYIGKARHWRKLLGGGMRQAGVLAAAGLVALDENVSRLAEDHENARLLAVGLANVPGITIDVSTVQSNIVVFDVAGLQLSPTSLAEQLLSMGVRVDLVGGSLVRAVTSYEVARRDIEYALECVAGVAGRTQPVLAQH